MSRIFISHSSRDRLAAEELATRLRAQGYQSLFLDFDPADGIPAGRDWEREIYAQLRACTAVVVLCSASSMTSDWCFAEITHARALGKRLFPVVIGDCTLRPLLLDTQVVDVRPNPEEGYARLWRGMRGAGLDPADSFAWETGRAPYPGLAPFQAADAAVYFGREDEQRRCLDTLAQMRRYGGERLLVVVGASGSGKSSLVRAGVLPRVARMPDWRVLGPMRPLRRPDAELAGLLPAGREAPPEGAEALGSALAAAFAAERERPAALLVVDQLEELLTTSEAGAAARFVAALRAALAAEAGELYGLATLRADYLAALQVHPAWAQLPFRQLPLAPMSTRHFAEIVAGPARVAGLDLEAGLVEALVQDTGRPDALPLLAFTLNRLWRDYGDDGRITLDEYRDRIGGLEGAIRQEAEAVLAALAPGPAQLAELRRAFRQLVRVEPEGGYTRRAARWQDLPVAAHPLLEALVAARLLVSGHEESAGGARTLEVAHEALFRAWDQLRRWLDEDRVFLLWRQHALSQTEAWQGAPDDPGLLLRGGPLAEAQRWQTERGPELGEGLRAFVAASGTAARRARRRRIALGAGVAAGLVASVVLGVGLWQQHEEAARQRIDSYWSGAVSARDAGDDALQAAHYLARAADLGGPGAARDDALIAIGMLTGGVELTGEIALPAAPDGVRVGADDGVVLAWRGREATLHDLAGGTRTAGIEHAEPVADGLVLAGRAAVTRDAGGGLRLWGGTGPPRTLASGGVAHFTADRDGRRLIGWGDDGLRLWDLPDGGLRGHLLPATAIAGAAFLDGGRLLAWSPAGRFWRIGEGAAPASWETGCAPRGVEVTADGRHALSFCDVALLRHDPAEARLAVRWDSPERIDGVRFDADGDRVVSWSAGRGRVRVWRADDGAPRFDRPLDREGSLSRVLLLPGGERLITAGADGRLEAWDLGHGELAARGRHHRAELPVMAQADTAATRVLAWSRAAGARLWDAGTLTPLSLPLAHAGRVEGASFYNGGRAIVTWADDGSVRTWRRQPAMELTAPAPVADEPLPPVEPADAGLQAKLDEIGLHGHRRLHARDGQVLVAAGPLARRLGPGTRVSPPLALDEGVRGGALVGDDRVVLWGNSSVRLWDAGGGRPLSGLLRSDVLFPERGGIDGGLWTSDGLRARAWRWPVPVPDTPTLAEWLALTNATRMDGQGAIRPLDREAWCALARHAGKAVVGCREEGARTGD